MAHINLDTVDADGAIREAADAVAGDTRMSFLRKGAIGGTAEAAFYDEATKNGIVKNKALTQFLATTKKDEDTHVATLKKALGSKAAKKPKFDFGKATTDVDTFAATALL